MPVRGMQQPSMMQGRFRRSPRLAMIVAFANLVMLSTAQAFALTGRLSCSCVEDTASLGTRHRTMTLWSVCCAGRDPESGPSSRGMNGERYRNRAVELLGNFLPSGGVVDTIDFSVPKRAGLSLEQVDTRSVALHLVRMNACLSVHILRQVSFVFRWQRSCVTASRSPSGL